MEKNQESSPTKPSRPYMPSFPGKPQQLWAASYASEAEFREKSKVSVTDMDSNEVSPEWPHSGGPSSRDKRIMVGRLSSDSYTSDSPSSLIMDTPLTSDIDLSRLELLSDSQVDILMHNLSPSDHQNPPSASGAQSTYSSAGADSEHASPQPSSHSSVDEEIDLGPYMSRGRVRGRPEYMASDDQSAVSTTVPSKIKRRKEEGSKSRKEKASGNYNRVWDPVKLEDVTLEDTKSVLKVSLH